MRTHIFIATLPFLHLLVLSMAIGQEQAEAPKPEFLTMQVLVLDPDGHPVENAKAFPSGLRTKVAARGHFFWSDKRFGPVPKVETNANGLADLPYPKYVIEEIEVGTVTVSVEHPDFVTFREDRRVDDKPAKVQLQVGYRIAATAVDAETGEPIKTNLYGLVSGDSRMSDWKLADNGQLISPVFEANTTWFRMIKIVPGQPNMYSELIEVDPTDRSRVLLRDIKLFKGTRVQGRLEESIPRPIRNGYVTAMIVRTGTKDNQNNWNSRWFWYDNTPISEDGEFVFESLPVDEVLQMIPVCDDWVPPKLAKEDVLPFFPAAAEKLFTGLSQPQLVRLEGLQVEPTLRMAAATSVKITVVDKDGSPLSGVDVASWPNQLWFEGGSNILGDVHSTVEWLLQAKHAGEFAIAEQNRYSAKTDENGIATIRSIPPNRTESLVARLTGYEMPLNGTEREIRIDLKPGVVTEVTIKMQPEGTDVLKDEAFQGGKDD
ncbi:MAG: carboxypeptidase-like regulatory domain-containing protein [Pirellulaceae bacterium]|nr:carboxypeptidase-like regulatory domain-containing protein [Pirellulaceae bacterium]